jgi:hypothetical protein
MSLQNISINIEKIIRNNKINKEYKIIKDMEDKITEIYQTHTETETDILDENKMGLLFEINDKFCNIQIKKNINDVLSHFNLDENILKNKTKIVFSGSSVRSVLSHKENYRKELFISCFDNVILKNIINLESYEETDILYFKKSGDYIINIFKFKYISPSEIILNGPYLKRFAYYNDKLYASPMFILEYNMKMKCMDINYLDPVFNTEVDMFDLEYPQKEVKNDIFDVIHKKDYSALKHITTYDLNKIKDNMTCIEYAMQLYIEEECDIIQHQLKLIIYDLLKHIKFKRFPAFYAELIKLEKYDAEMYEILLTQEYLKLRQSIQAFSTLEELNISILNYYIINDMCDEFYSYIKSIYKKPSSDIFYTIIDSKPKKIITEGIKKKYFSDYNIYKIILLSEELNYINLINFDINIAVNFLDKIIKKCLTKSFYYLYKKDQNIINTLDANNNTLLHNIHISEKEDLIEDMIKLLITLDETLFMKKNNDGYTPLLYHAQNNIDICVLMIKVIEEKNLEKLFNDKTNDNNNILHILCKKNSNLRIIKKILYDNMQLINDINDNKETPIMAACKNKCEDIYYLLKGVNADLNIVDKFGNTLEHYICLNEMCIGMAIKNTENIFGYTPKDYCKISPDYYMFFD